MSEKFKTVTFQENAIYDTDMAAAILHRHPKTIRRMCKDGVICARLDRGGYSISGWAIRAYAENRLPVSETAFVK